MTRNPWIWGTVLGALIVVGAYTPSSMIHAVAGGIVIGVSVCWLLLKPNPFTKEE